MGEEPRNMDKNLRSRFWGFRSWKRHSTILLVAGVLYTLIGLQYVYGAPNKTRDDSLVVTLQFAPIHFWGWVFVVIGLAALLSSIWPPTSEIWGYMALTGLSAGWAATYLMGFLFFHARTSLSGVIVWSLLAFMWWGISGLLNPDRTAAVAHGSE